MAAVGGAESDFSNMHNGFNILEQRLGTFFLTVTLVAVKRTSTY